MTRRILVVATAILAILAFGIGEFLYERNTSVTSENVPVPVEQSAKQVEEPPAQTVKAVSKAEGNEFVRPYSPVFGSKDAPVTIVEFFDPACEACRAFQPYLKTIMDKYSESVRVVVRYAAFHPGSEEAVRILEAARLQGLFKPVLESILEAQPKWAAHGKPDLSKAWEAAAAAGLDVARARKEMLLPGITAALKQDMVDIKALGVKRTPTFFVNGKSLKSFGPQQLANLVHLEVQAAGNR